MEASSAKVFMRNAAGTGSDYKTMEKIMQERLRLVLQVSVRIVSGLSQACFRIVSGLCQDCFRPIVGVCIVAG